MILGIVLLLGIGVAYLIVRHQLDNFANRCYHQGVNDNGMVQHYRMLFEQNKSRADAAWELAFRWHREVVALNKAQRRLRRRLRGVSQKGPQPPT